MSFSILVTLIGVGIVFLIMFLIIFILIHQRKMIANDAKLIEKENIYNKAILNATIEIAEEERGKIARNVHDDLGMMLHALKTNISKIRRNINDVEVAYEALNNSDKIIENTINTVRTISSDLLPGPLVNIGFVAGISYLCDQINSNNLIAIRLITEVEKITMEKKNTIHLFRLVKEVLNNIIKHTKATTVEIKLTEKNKAFEIEIIHNGMGISNDSIKELAETSKGIGLRSIMGRAQLIGATVDYFKFEEKPAKVIIKTPIL